MALTPYSTAVTDQDTPVKKPSTSVRRRQQKNLGGTSSGLSDWFHNMAKKPDVRRPDKSQQQTAAQGSPLTTAPNIVQDAQMPQIPMLPEVEDIGAAAALGRQPGIGQPGSLRGMTNVKRRRV
jgi:hypothetical protein